MPQPQGHAKGNLTMEINEEIKLIKASVEIIETWLGMSTGLEPLQRKTIGFYTIATHSLPTANSFPLLVCRGPMGTGKSECSRIVKAFAYNPRAMSLRSMSPPAFRDELAQTHNGTAIIEEADAGWSDTKNYENLLSDRYHRDSAKGAHKILRKDGGWSTLEVFYFGASVLHKRVNFADAALDGRSITIQFKANHRRKYTTFSEADSVVVKLKKDLADFTFVLPDLKQSFAAAGRILASFTPILAVAEWCDDNEFLKQLVDWLITKSKQLVEDQATEPDGLVVRGIIDCLSTSSGLVFHNLKLKDVRTSIFHNSGVDLQHRQIAAHARELGFHTKNSHGNIVIVPKPQTLLAACQTTMYEDEQITELGKSLEKSSSKSKRADEAG